MYILAHWHVVILHGRWMSEWGVGESGGEGMWYFRGESVTLTCFIGTWVGGGGQLCECYNLF